MDHIIVPVDFSDDAFNALDYAVKIANKMNMSIRLMHVKRKHADYNSSFNMSDFDEVLTSGIRDKFDAVIAQYNKNLNKEFDYIIRQGRVCNEICNQAKYGDAEMIIMGTHGINGIKERWLGSNAFRVVDSADSPVLTVRFDFIIRPMNKIVLPIDISKTTRLKVPYVAKLAKLFNAEILVVDVRDSNRISTRKILNDYMAQVINYLDAHKIKCSRDSLKGKSITNSIIEYAVLNDADLIGIMNERADKIRNFWLGSQVQQMINHSPIPVLTVP